jgi:O-antigen/teichoic acid export membrane protein
MPLLSTWLSFQRSILVISKHTRLITRATGIEIILIVLILFFSISVFNIIGAVGAAIAYVIGRIGANFSLLHFQIKYKNNQQGYNSI